MGQYDDGGQAKKEEGLFDLLLRNLDKAISLTATDAERYKNYVNKLDSLALECDLENKKKELSISPPEPMAIPDDVTNKLRALLSQLETTNSKNAEILKHFDTLV
jgi:hypothetical protein